MKFNTSFTLALLLSASVASMNAQPSVIYEKIKSADEFDKIFKKHEKETLMALIGSSATRDSRFKFRERKEKLRKVIQNAPHAGIVYACVDARYVKPEIIDSYLPKHAADAMKSLPAENKTLPYMHVFITATAITQTTANTQVNS